MEPIALQIAGGVLVATIVGASGFVFSKFINHLIASNNELKLYVDKRHEHQEKKIEFIDEKVDKITRDYASVFEELIRKFSNWEDRIKKIIDTHLYAGINNTSTNDRLEKTLETEIRELDDRTKIDLENLRLKIRSVKNDITNLSGKINNSDKIDKYYRSPAQQTAINDIMEKVTEIDELHNKHYENVNNNSRKLFTICKKIVTDYKAVLIEISNLKLAIRNSSKIQFIEGKNKGNKS